VTALPHVAIVVPCFNEANRLESDRFVAFAGESGVRFVFCDDGSTDATGEVLDALVARSGGTAEKLTLPQNRGKAEAVRQGLLRAIEGGADLVGYFDADLATPLAEIPKMAEAFVDPEVLAVTGARIQLQGSRIERRPVRHYAGRVFATAAARVLGTAYYDTQCGAKLFRNGPVLEAALAEPFHSAWIFDVELLGRLLIEVDGASSGPRLIREHPLATWRDVGGSRLGPSAFVRAPLELALLAFELKRWARRRAAAHLRASAQ
jgi:dolichyl-phosphate beta-glucosyltransferase